VEDHSAPIPRENGQAWKDHVYRSMRAVKNNLPTPSGKVEKPEGPRSTRAIKDRPGYPQKLIGGLGGRAQWKINLAPSLKDYEQAWRGIMYVGRLSHRLKKETMRQCLMRGTVQLNLLDAL
jgi:hypothetical protein